MTIIIHLCSLESFGVPYLSGIAPFHISDLQDMVLRTSHKFMRKQPSQIKNKDRLTNVPRGE